MNAARWIVGEDITDPLYAAVAALMPELSDDVRRGVVLGLVAACPNYGLEVRSEGGLLVVGVSESFTALAERTSQIARGAEVC